MNEEQKNYRQHTPLNQSKIAFITNLCSPYIVKHYEMIAKKFDTEFYFTGGHEAYWDSKNKLCLGDFQGEFLSGLWVGNHFKISWRLFSLFWVPWDIMMKSIDDRFALPLCFGVAKIRRKPFILWTGLWHHPQNLFHKLSFIFTKLIYKYSDAVVVYGEHIKQYLMTIGINEEKIFCAPHAVDNGCFNKVVSDNEKSEIKSQLNVFDERILLYTGRLESCKGIEYLLDAVSMIDNRTVMVFVGTGSLRESLEQKCRELNVESRFLGFIPYGQLYKYYAIADIFILPSITTVNFKEPWGFVVNEAMNQGCPVIATDAVGAAAGGLIEDGVNGFVVKEKNAGALRDAINHLYSNEALRSKMSAYSKEKIKHWNYENMTQGFINAVEYVKNKNSR